MKHIKAKVHLIPTDRTSNIVKILKDTISYTTTNNIPGGIYYHIYITSDEPTEEGDWYISDKNIPTLCEDEEDVNYLSSKPELKIIATTDTSLLLPAISFKDWDGESRSLPQPSQDFIDKYIEKYNKGEQITDVSVEYEAVPHEWDNPMNNPEGLDNENSIYIIKTDKNNTITIKAVKDNWNRKEVETLLHALYSDLTNDSTYDGVFYDKWIEENLS